MDQRFLSGIALQRAIGNAFIFIKKNPEDNKQTIKKEIEASGVLFPIKE